MLAAKVIILVTALVCTALVAASLGMTQINWWKVTYQFSSATKASVMSKGPFQTCTSDCAANDFTISNFGSCTRDTTTQKARFGVVAALAVISAICSLGGGIAALVPVKIALAASSGLLLVGSLLSAIAMGLFYSTMENWLFCDTDFCTYTSNQGTPFTTCVTTVFTGPYVMQGLATILMCLSGAFAATLLPLWPAPPPEPPKPTEPTAEYVAFSHIAPANETKAAPVAEAASAPAPASGAHTTREDADHSADAIRLAGANEDWVWDEGSNMYWSDSAAMYYDSSSGMYYNPTKCYWYDAAEHTVQYD